MFRNKKKACVAISIHANAVRFALVIKEGKQLSVTRYGQYPGDDFFKSLSEIRKDINSAVPYHLILPHRFIMMKRLQFQDNIQETEIRKLLTLNAKQYFSYPKEAVYFDFEFICKFKKIVRVVTIKKEEIDKWLSLFKGFGLNLKKITVDVISLEQFLQQKMSLDPMKVYGIFLCCGEELLQIIFVMGYVYYIHTAKLIANSKNCLEDEIEKFFRLYEMHQGEVYPVTDVIIFSEKPQSLTKQFSGTFYQSTKDFFPPHSMPVSYLVTLGATLND